MCFPHGDFASMVIGSPFCVCFLRLLSLHNCNTWSFTFSPILFADQDEDWRELYTTRGPVIVHNVPVFVSASNIVLSTSNQSSHPYQHLKERQNAPVIGEEIMSRKCLRALNVPVFVSASDNFLLTCSQSSLPYPIWKKKKTQVIGEVENMTHKS